MIADDDSLLIGWPFDEPPLRYGEVDGIPWAIRPGGLRTGPSVNGYARIPWEGHPWSGATDYHQIDVDVHCGLTYGPKPPFEMGKMAHELAAMTRDSDSVPFDASFIDPDLTIPATLFRETGGWIGFDTGHAFDEWTDEALAEAGLRREPLPWMPLPDPKMPCTRWTIDQVVEEAKSLAAQIAAHAGRRVGPR